MTTNMTQRLVDGLAHRWRPGRRGVLRGAAVVGAAVVTSPWTYLSRPASAYDAVCGSHSECADGYTVFCCTINGGRNTCPPDSFIAGWWKADSSSFCGGAARYYIDCNAYRNGAWSCRCNDSTCDRRRVACNQFRYGQCNTQVPYSETGPVVCRLVSCTPPWQQYAGTCSSTSRTDNNTATHAAPCLSGAVPVGRLDSVTTNGSRVTLVGWAYDPDQPATEIDVAVYADGAGIGWHPTGVPRPDVNAAHGSTGRHGFDLSFDHPDGAHTFEVYGINVGPGSSNPLLGRTTVVVNPGAQPRGALDDVTTSGSTVRLRGWAYDPDDTARALDVHLYEDGQPVSVTRADSARPDVDRAFGVGSEHGFDVSLTRPDGRHEYRAEAISVGGGDDALLGRRTVEVNPGAVPRGALDDAVGLGDSVRLRGWAYDPDEPARSLSVAVYVDGQGLSWYEAAADRPDVNTAFGIPGRHGYDMQVTVPPGSRTFTVYAINVGGGADNPLIGRRTVPVGRPGPIGNLEQATAVGTSVRLVGWALDPDRTSTAIAVDVYVDGGAVGRFPTGEPRPDVQRAHTVDGEHGFDLTVQAAAGTHTVSVYGIGLRANNLLGSRTVVTGSGSG